MALTGTDLTAHCFGTTDEHGWTRVTANCIHIFPKIGKLIEESTGQSPTPPLPHQMGKGVSFRYIIVNTTLFPSPFDGEGGRPKAGRVRIRASKPPSPNPTQPMKKKSPSLPFDKPFDKLRASSGHGARGGETTRNGVGSGGTHHPLHTIPQKGYLRTPLISLKKPLQWRKVSCLY